MLLQREVGLIIFEMYVKIIFDLYLTKISKESFITCIFNASSLNQMMSRLFSNVHPHAQQNHRSGR